MDGIMGMVSAFIGIAILLSIGIILLGNGLDAGSCASLPGGNTGTNSSVAVSDYTGWAKQCVENNEQAQSSYDLLSVILIVLAAVAILAVVRFL